MGWHPALPAPDNPKLARKALVHTHRSVTQDKCRVPGEVTVIPAIPVTTSVPGTLGVPRSPEAQHRKGTQGRHITLSFGQGKTSCLLLLLVLLFWKQPLF